MPNCPLVYDSNASLGGNGTNIGAIRRRGMVLIVLSDFVEVVLVQLPDKTRKVAMLEMLRKDGLGELLVLQWRSASASRLWSRIRFKILHL